MEAKPFNIVGTVIISVAVVASTYIFGQAIIRTRTGGDEIRVTGSARKEISADFIIWRAKLSWRGDGVGAGYASIKQSADTLVSYLEKNGVKADEIVRGAVSTRKLYEARQQGSDYSEDAFRRVVGYDITQSIEVRSSQVDRVDEISRKVTELIAQGVPLESEAPEFLYTKISEAKVEILGAAAEDARKRAEEIASKSGSRAGEVRSARMSPLQITPRFSTLISSEGQNDTSSKEKAITAIVTMTFGIR